MLIIKKIEDIYLKHTHRNNHTTVSQELLMECAQNDFFFFFRASQGLVGLLPVGLDKRSHRLKIDFLNMEQ